jgi:hypothetical protein
MSLVFDRSEVRPGLHALIVGVSRYPHLAGPHDLPTERSFGMCSLTSAASSAFTLFGWLKQRAQPPVPLASIRLMIAPSEEELAQTPELGEHASACSFDDFIKEVWEWRKQAGTSENGMTLFYSRATVCSAQETTPYCCSPILAVAMLPCCAMR